MMEHSLPDVLAARRRRVRRMGLGDLVHLLARPIARLLGLTRCQACHRRRLRLNRFLRF